MDSAASFVPFPLYHGTSSHFLSAFKPGTTPVAWPYKDIALGLLERVWVELSQSRHQVPRDVRDELLWDVTFEEIPWYVKNVIDQKTGSSNWQHGELYLTPNEGTAVNYACTGAIYGGELLTMCKTAIDALARIDYRRADQLTQSAESLSRFFRGTELPPILVEFAGIKIGDLSTETQRPDILQTLPFLSKHSNFRLAKGCGVVERVFEVHVSKKDDSSPSFSFEEIHSSDQWN